MNGTTTLWVCEALSFFDLLRHNLSTLRILQLLACYVDAPLGRCIGRPRAPAGE